MVQVQELVQEHAETTATKPEPAAAPAAVFTSTELQEFQTEDHSAAGAVVCIMITIFTLAILGYSFVLYWVYFNPN